MRKKILVVDDSESWLFAAEYSLKLLGFLVTTHDCGLDRSFKEAIGAVGEEKPDFILLDHLLNKNFDGLELARGISERCASATIISTSLTIRYDDNLKDKYVELGVTHFSEKNMGKIHACILNTCFC